MHKRIIMLAKIALIIAAAQIQITAANFISNPANMPSNVIYAKSNEGEQTKFAVFKKEIERTVRQKANQPLSEADHGRIKQKIQDFIGNDERIALVLYIANQWNTINELGWKSDAVSNYVQNCLRDLYNSTQDGPTIQVDNPYHTGIAAAIENLNSNPIGNNKPRAALRALLYPGLNQTNQPTELDKAEGQEITNDKKELTFNEEKLIHIIYQCAHIFKKSQTGNTNEELQPKTGLIQKHISKLLLPIHASELKWIRDNKDKINELIAGTENDLQELLQKYIIKEEDDEIKKIIYKIITKIVANFRPDILLTNILLSIHTHNIGIHPQQEHKDKGLICLAQQLKPNLAKAFLSSDENGANKTTATHSYKTQTQETKLLKEFLNFIMGWEITKQTSKNNRSTIFTEAAEKIQQEAHKQTSIKLTQTQKDLLKLIKIAYSSLKRHTIGEMKQLQNDEHNYKQLKIKTYNINYNNIYFEKYEQILDKVLAEEKIEASQIAKEIETKFTELQHEEDIHREQEERAKRKEEEERRQQEEDDEKRKKAEREKSEQEERKSYAQAFQIIADMLIAQTDYFIEWTTERPVLRRLSTYAEKIRDAISNNTINKEGKTIERYLEDLYEAAYAGIDVRYDVCKQLIKEAILPHQQQQCQTQNLETNKEQTEFKIKRLLLLIRLIAQVERGQFDGGPYEEVSSANEGPTQPTSTSNNLQERKQDDSILNEYHITHQAIIEGKQKEQHIKFKNISLKQLNICSHLLEHTLYNLYSNHITGNNNITNVAAKDYADAFDKILLILNKDILNEGTNKKTDVQNTNANPGEQIIIKQNNQICSKLEEYINTIPYWDKNDWKATTQRYIKQLQWIIQRITKEELSQIPGNTWEIINNHTQYCIESLQYKINNQKKREQEEEEEKRKKAEEERLKKEEEERLKKEERERAEKIEKLKQEVNANFSKNKESNSKISTTQKIINNLSATNKMLQIIMQILY